MSYSDPIAGTAAEWLARARGSLALAKQPKPDEAFWEDLCYQAQQAAEKALKAVYMRDGLRFEYTHNLARLGSGLERKGVGVPDLVREAAVLTRYAVESRYPGAAEAVTEAEYRDAVHVAEAVVSWAEAIIRGPG